VSKDHWTSSNARRLGLSGATGRQSGPPARVVCLFFAGPHPGAVGKTELAKRVAKLLFGDPHAYLRFRHERVRPPNKPRTGSSAHLPGYVGLSRAGGELTGAVRRRPFPRW